MPILLYIAKNVIPIILGVGISSMVWIITNTLYIIPQAEGKGYDKRVAEVAVVDAKNDSISKGNLTDLQSKSDYDFCVSRMQRRGMPIDPCQQLLGIR